MVNESVNVHLLPLNGDRPIRARVHDRLGFSASAQHIARSIEELASPDGFVIGIEGDWGCGKSSFINLVSEALRTSAKPPEVIHFLPWLISSRNALLRELFSEITRAALRIELIPARAPRTRSTWAKFKEFVTPARHSEREARREKIEDLFSKLSSRLAPIGAVVGVAGKLGMPLPGATGDSDDLDSVRRILNRASLSEEKDLMTSELSLLDRRIVVFIDDLDRLEPAEACEVLRLVRAVADFPNIVYVLSYSRQVVARNVAVALGIDAKKAEEFVEKIVQATFAIPQPEAFDLRRLFRQELQLLYPVIFSSEDPDDRRIQQRLSGVVDVEGGRSLKTPRHVVRAINSLRFHASAVLDHIDLPDMVWLQLVRIRSLPLYEWIESYLTGVAAVSVGATISAAGQSASAASLAEILKSDATELGNNLDERWWALTTYLPGVYIEFPNRGEKAWRVFGEISSDALAKLIVGRRLGSPQHHRYYFALSHPAHAITDLEFEAFVGAAANSPNEAASQFRNLAVTRRPQGGVMAEALLSRLGGGALQRLSAAASMGVLLAVADGIDYGASTVGQGDMGRYWIWKSATELLRHGLRQVGAEREEFVGRLFRDAASLGWLTDVFREETYDHGVYGKSPVPEEKRILTPTEFHIATRHLLDRFRAVTPVDVRRIPGASGIFYAWEQVAPDAREEVRQKFEELTRDDTDFLDLLEIMRGWGSVNGEVFRPLRQKEFGWLADFAGIKARLRGIEDGDGAKSMKVHAIELLQAIDADRLQTAGADDNSDYEE